jgi:RNA polymerase sigma factor (TIGR02999 family)
MAYHPTPATAIAATTATANTAAFVERGGGGSSGGSPDRSSWTSPASITGPVYALDPPQLHRSGGWRLAFINLMNPNTPSLTQLIHRAQDGDRDAIDALYAATYDDLRRLAHARLRAGRRDTLLDTGGLVHESYVRFVGGRLNLENRVHFMRWAARVMRSVIIDFARRRLAGRRGAGAARVTLDAELMAGGTDTGEETILGVHRALERLSTIDPRLTHVVELRYFAGLTEPQIAEALGVTERTVRRDWHKARLLLQDVLA